MLFRLSSSSSKINSEHSGKSIQDLIKSFDKKTIKSCIVGVSKILFNNISHTSLFLSDLEANKLEKIGDKEVDGIIIEYGYYDPKKNDDEWDNVDKGYVIYRYGRELGGLRYYTNTFTKYIIKFCDLAYIILDVNKDNQITFSYFIDQVAPIKEEKWIKKNYVFTKDLFNKTFNCRTFTAHALNVIKPIYDKRLIKKGKSASISKNKEETLIPNEVLKILKKYEDEF